MKITRRQLRQIIKEEVSILSEQLQSDEGVDWYTPGVYTLLSPESGIYYLWVEPGDLVAGDGRHIGNITPHVITGQGNGGEIISVEFGQEYDPLRQHRVRTTKYSGYVNAGDPVAKIRVPAKPITKSVIKK